MLSNPLEQVLLGHLSLALNKAISDPGGVYVLPHRAQPQRNELWPQDADCVHSNARGGFDHILDQPEFSRLVGLTAKLPGRRRVSLPPFLSQFQSRRIPILTSPQVSSSCSPLSSTINWSNHLSSTKWSTRTQRRAPAL